MSMATLREWLTNAGFNWDAGRIIFHDTGDKSPDYGDVIAARVIARDDPILDKSFDSGFGDAQCPRIVAEDAERIYFPGTYDGSTWLDWVYKDLDHYLDKEHSTPYVGGG
jgi:hypothetical protein